MGGRNFTDTFYLVAWTLFLLAVPFYVMGKTPVPQTLHSLQANQAELSEKLESGVPQLANYIMGLLMAVALTRIGFRLAPRHVVTVVVFGSFLAYVILINLAWTTLTLDLSISKNTFFYAYDVVLYVTFLVLYSHFGEQFLRVTMHGVAASIFLQVLLSPLAVDLAGFRQCLFFNNPVQLGYYAIAAANIFFVGTQRFRVGGLYQALFYTGVGYLVVLSLTKACLLALALLGVLALRERPFAVLGGLLVAAVLVLGSTLVLQDSAPSVIGNLQKRLATEEADESVEMRGYDRLVNHPEYLFFGAGEGAYNRFQSVLRSELHSSYGTLVFCYGVVGAALFTAGLFLACDLRLKWLISLSPVFLYGLIHHGLRFTLFWVLLANVCCLARAAGVRSASASVPGLAPAPAR
jgi:hypothetical protein